ncbi:MAG: RsmE family RNA methyltransferase [Cytophagales bacterium]|nr:RsmE family RNA methyltransferase [Cytophagales bacterium]
MTQNIFFAQNIINDNILLVHDEYHHCKNVMRYGIGSTVMVTDGNGNVYEGNIAKYDKNQAIINISLHKYISSPDKYTLHIAIAPTKNADRIEYFVEKAVEIGLHKLTFIMTERTERKAVNMDRIHKIAVAAMKQSQKYYLPQIHQPVDYKTFIQSENTSLKCIAYIENDVGQVPISKYFGNGNNNYNILIGPEGDFSPEEITLAKKYEYIPVSLGTSRLRTDTAGIYVAACARSMLVV